MGFVWLTGFPGQPERVESTGCLALLILGCQGVFPIHTKAGRPKVIGDGHVCEGDRCELIFIHNSVFPRMRKTPSNSPNSATRNTQQLAPKTITATPIEPARSM